MSKAGALAVAILVIGLTVFTAGSTLPNAQQSVSANDSGTGAKPGTVTLSSAVGPGESAWARLRWLFAGIGASAVLLVARRQVVILIGYRENPAHFRTENRRHADGTEPVTASSEAVTTAPDRDWFRSPAVATAGER